LFAALFRLVVLSLRVKLLLRENEEAPERFDVDVGWPCSAP
jgi:hypothetical protein